MGRIVAALVGLPCLVLGGFGLAMAYAPDPVVFEPVVEALRQGVYWANDRGAELGFDAADVFVTTLSGPIPRFGLSGLALACLLFAAGVIGGGEGKPGKKKEAAAADAEPEPSKAPVDKRQAKKVVKQAAALRKKGELVEAARMLWSHDELEKAADYFIEAEEFVSAAEIRHDQNRFLESAELHMRGRNFEAAGSIFAQQGEFQKAAECYLEAGHKSQAAEMFEEAGDHLKAAQCFRETEFMRHAAANFVKVQRWKDAAQCLEDVFRDESSKMGADEKKQAEMKKIVRQAGKLYQRCEFYDKALDILRRGACWPEAAAVAMTLQRFDEAAELYRNAGDVLKAAEALRALGENESAARLMGQYHRDRGETKEAAAALEEAGDFLEAGDLHRAMENYLEAGTCFRKMGEYGQAAEMFKLIGERIQAGECFEQASRFTEAAECFALAGEGVREAELLDRAGEYFSAGNAYHREGMDDEAITALQKVDPSSEQFGEASALLGDIFLSRGQLNLAIKKLQQALGDADLDRETLPVFYTLATIHQANDDPREAVELYEKILAFDYHYQDVEARLIETRELVQSAEPISEVGSTNPDGGSSPGFAHGNTQPNRYQIIGELGRGGMGIVYKAKDTVLDRLVAYKVLPDSFKENEQAVNNFLREAQAAAKLNHPNIVTVYDTGEQQGRYYIAMEYVEGTTIKEILRRRGVISPAGILHVVVQISEALAYAHEKKVVHRDIKPANTMWTRDKKAKLMDFGLAKVVEEVRNHTTVVAGTPYYMSPEQTLGKNVDHRTDVYSLGVMVFEMATGTVPFKEGNIPYHHVHTLPPDIRELRPELPASLAAIVSRCLQKDPANRYQSTGEILAEVRQTLSGSVTRTHHGG